MDDDAKYVVSWYTGHSKLESGSRVTAEGLIEYWGRLDRYDDRGRLTERGPTTVNFVVGPRSQPLELADWAAVVGGVILHAAGFCAFLALAWFLVA